MIGENGKVIMLVNRNKDTYNRKQMNILLRGISYTGHWLYCRLPHYSSDTIPVPKYITFNF